MNRFMRQLSGIESAKIRAGAAGDIRVPLRYGVHHGRLPAATKKHADATDAFGNADFRGFDQQLLTP